MKSFSTMKHIETPYSNLSNIIVKISLLLIILISACSNPKKEIDRYTEKLSPDCEVLLSLANDVDPQVVFYNNIEHKIYAYDIRSKALNILEDNVTEVLGTHEAAKNSDNYTYSIIFTKEADICEYHSNNDETITLASNVEKIFFDNSKADVYFRDLETDSGFHICKINVFNKNVDTLKRYGSAYDVSEHVDTYLHYGKTNVVIEDAYVDPRGNEDGDAGYVYEAYLLLNPSVMDTLSVENQILKFPDFWGWDNDENSVVCKGDNMITVYDYDGNVLERRYTAMGYIIESHILRDKVILVNELHDKAFYFDDNMTLTCYDAQNGSTRKFKSGKYTFADGTTHYLDFGDQIIGTKEGNQLIMICGDENFNDYLVTLNVWDFGLKIIAFGSTITLWNNRFEVSKTNGKTEYYDFNGKKYVPLDSFFDLLF